MKKRYILLAVAIAVGGYLYSGLPLPSSHAGDPRIASVFAREGLGFGQCVTVGDESRDELVIPLKSDENGPPGQLTVSRFESQDVQRLATQLSSGEFAIVRPRVDGIQIGPDQEGDGCGAYISSMIVVDDIAIVRFSAPGGDIGAHAFQKGAFGWRSIERVHLGWW